MKGYVAGQTGKCPCCGISVRFESVKVEVSHGFGEDRLKLHNLKGQNTTLVACSCPVCSVNILSVMERKGGVGVPFYTYTMIWPIDGSRKAPAEVKNESPRIADEFEEAALVLRFSEKASAALSRRCLQHVLIEKAGVNPQDNLSRQIDDVLPQLPSYLKDNVDAIRVVGNFAAHPIKSERTGEIVDVEAGEAEWILDVLEELFDYYYVAPAKAKARRDKLDAKLAEAGRRTLKSKESPANE